MSSVFIDSIRDGYGDVLQRGFQFVDPGLKIGPSDRICVKPNLTFPQYREGVMTSPAALEALILYLKQFTDRIVICESDSGGYNPFSMDDVFEATGIAAFARRHGVRIANMSHTPSRPIHFRYRLRRFAVPLPTLLLDETELFITMPVPKVHLNTIVSLSLKNQWGVIQQPALRLKLHPYFNEVIYQVNKALPRALAVVDGTFGLTHSGPMRGTPVRLDWLAVSDNLFYADAFVSRLMGFDFRRIPHLRHCLRKEGIKGIEGLRTNVDPAAFMSSDFYLKREWTDYPGLLTFNSRALAYVGYESVMARPLHWLLYRFREPFY